MPDLFIDPKRPKSPYLGLEPEEREAAAEEAAAKAVRHSATEPKLTAEQRKAKADAEIAMQRHLTQERGQALASYTELGVLQNHIDACQRAVTINDLVVRQALRDAYSAGFSAGFKRGLHFGQMHP